MGDDKRAVLVTGGAGFIGSSIVERLLEREDRVIVVDTLRHGNKLPEELLSRVELHVCDVRDEGRMLSLSAGVDCIFHLAAILGVDYVADHPIETMETEILALRSVARAATRNGVKKVVYASSSSVYGDSVDGHPSEESARLAPRTSYAVAKRHSETYLEALSERTSIDTVVLRFFNVYGDRQDDRMVIPRFFRQAMRGGPVIVYGSGEQTRDFTWIDDAVEAAFRAEDATSGFDVFNVCSQRETQIIAVARMIRELSGTRAEIRHVPVPRRRQTYEAGRRVGSVAKLSDRSGYQPATTVQGGLGTMFQRLRSRAETG